MHKVPWFWHFHRLHHSATEFNVITGIRISIAETFFNDIVILILLSLIFGLPSPKIVLLVMFVYAIIDLLQHSDLPWDYGIVGYVIASPRYHRMHHSTHAEDLDTNYGNIFSFWDYWFGTVADRYRHSSTIADGCSLGLRDEIETEKINDGWYLAAFQATGVYYAISLLRHAEKMQGKSERFGVQVNTKLVGGD